MNLPLRFKVARKVFEWVTPPSVVRALGPYGPKLIRNYRGHVASFYPNVDSTDDLFDYLVRDAVV